MSQVVRRPERNDPVLIETRIYQRNPKTTFLYRIALCVGDHKIPKELVMNFDETGLQMCAAATHYIRCQRIDSSPFGWDGR